MKEELLHLTEAENALVERYAAQNGVTIEEAASKLISQGLAKRVRKTTGKKPSSSVKKFYGRKK